MKRCYLLLIVLFAFPVYAMQVAGVSLDDAVTVDGQKLSLNGAGIRSKFFVDVYVGSLYLVSPQESADAVIADTGPKRIGMDFLYSKVERDKVVEGWNESFAANTPTAALAELQARINQFNGLFPDLYKGDRVDLDYVPNKGTIVVINGAKKGMIPGQDFHQALLRIWLGSKPVTKDLKRAMLGQ